MSASKLGDYRSGEGRLVLAESEHFGGTASVGVRLTPTQRLWQGLLYQRDGPTADPALPVDTVSSDFVFYATTYAVHINRLMLRTVLPTTTI